MRLRENSQASRRFLKIETFRGNVAHPRSGQQRHRAAANSNFQGGRNYRLAARIKASRQAGFRFSEVKDRGVCRRLLLAWLSHARDQAKASRGILGCETEWQQGPGSESQPAVEGEGVAGDADLGTRVEAQELSEAAEAAGEAQVMACRA